MHSSVKPDVGPSSQQRQTAEPTSGWQSAIVKVRQGRSSKGTGASKPPSLPQRLLTFLLCLLTLASFSAHAADTPVQLIGVYKTIDIRLARDTIHGLAKTKAKEQGTIIKGITAKPENFAPPVLYFLSQVLFQRGQKDDAMFWYYAGQLRARIDANICADKTARGAVNVLNQKFGQPINQYAFQDLPRLTNTVEKVIAWEAKTPYNYDRRWINLEGVNAITGETNAPLSAPEDQWEKIRKATRDEFRSTFYQALTEYHKMK